MSIAPVLFSVLVLHWITSKDNASTLPSLQNGESANIRSMQSPSSSKQPVPGPPPSELAGYELGLREWQKTVGVTTVVTAKEPDDELGVDRINSIPPNVVTVEVCIFSNFPSSECLERCGTFKVPSIQVSREVLHIRRALPRMSQELRYTDIS